MTLAYIGLGSNLHEPLQQLRDAVSAIALLQGCKIQAISSIYHSKPMGPQDQPDYLNAVMSLNVDISPAQLLASLQLIEKKQGRERKADRWGPRTIDLDILLYNHAIIDEEHLVVPHPGLTQRAFVVIPLAEIAPILQLPDGQHIHSVLTQFTDEPLLRIDDRIDIP